MDTVKKAAVVEPLKSVTPPIKAQPQAEHKIDPKATGGCCGSEKTHKA